MLLLKIIYDGIIALNENCEKDKRITFWPLIGKPWPMLTIVGLYLVIVLKWGPKFMAHRKPYKVEGLMKLYNLVQILLNGFIFIESLRYSYMSDNFNLVCQKYDLNDTSHDTMKLVRPAVLYYTSKYLDLLDTVFFLLRKKFNQISFLHVYHHALMIMAVHIYCVDAFGTQFTATGILNSFIHTCMYTYYLVAAFQPNMNLDPWKRIMTRMQLLQFMILSLVFGVPLFNNWCKLPIHWLMVAFLQNTFMIVLFSNFYYNSYVLKDKKRAKKIETPSKNTLTTK